MGVVTLPCEMQHVSVCSLPLLIDIPDWFLIAHFNQILLQLIHDSLVCDKHVPAS